MSKQAQYFNLLQIKASSKSKYIAYYIDQYRQYEQIDEASMKSFLCCSNENYFKLSMCLAPDTEAEDFKQRVDKIAAFANASPLAVIRMLKRVNTLQSFDYSESMLMAARKKDSNNNHDNE